MRAFRQNFAMVSRLSVAFLVVGLGRLVNSLNLFGLNFEGDGTYYGDQGDQSSGNCAFGVTGAASLPWTRGLTGPKFVAIDKPLYFDGAGASASCGLCLAMYGSPADAGCTTCGTTPVPQTVQYVMASNQARPSSPYRLGLSRRTPVQRTLS